MSKLFYKPKEEEIGTEEVLDWIFRELTVKYGLVEFPLEFFGKIDVFEKESGKFYINCLKRKKIFLFTIRIKK